MLIKEITDNYTMKEDKIRDYGFSLKDKHYLLKKNLKEEDFYVLFILSDDSFEVKVYEDGEEYLPFYVKKTTGDYSTSLRIEVFDMIEEILDHCFIKVNRRQEILDYVKARYHSDPYYSREEVNRCLLIKGKSGVYGLLLRIPGSYLDLDEAGEVDILNVKASKETIKQFIDHKIYFPAYSMDQSHWITILLNKKTDMNVVNHFIDNSYYLTKNK